MSNPKICLKCKEIVTFCECEKSITDKDEYIEYLEEELKDYNYKFTELSGEITLIMGEIDTFLEDKT